MLVCGVRGIIHKSPGWPRLEATLYAGEQSSCLGSEQSALTDCHACAGQNEPRSRHVVEEQCLFRGMDAPPNLPEIVLHNASEATLTSQCQTRRPIGVGAPTAI